MSNSSENKRIAKNTLYLYLRMAILLVVGLYSSRITLMALGVSDYGIFNVVGGIVTMFVFINYAMINSTQRYITYELGKGDTTRLGTLFSTSINIHVLISVLIVILSETIGLWFLYNKMVIPQERIQAAFWIFQFSIISCVFTVVSAPYNAIIIAYEKMSAFALISLLDAFLKLGIVLLLLKYNADRLILYGGLILLIAVFDIFVYQIYSNKNFSESKYRYVLDRTLMKEMTGFASWNLLGNFAFICYTQGLNLLLNVFFNPVVNAARGIAVQVQNVVSSFIYNVENAIKPQITKSYAAGDTKRMHKLMSISARMTFYVLWLITLPLILETERVLDLWLVEVPEHTANFLRLTLLLLMTDSMTGPLLTAAQSTGDIKKYQLTVSSLSITILPLSYVALQIYELPELVFLVNIIVWIVVQIVKLFVVSKQVGLSKRYYIVNVFLRSIVVALVSGIIPFAIWYLMGSGIFRLLVVGTVSIVFVTVAIYSIGISREERQVINSKISFFVSKISLFNSNR